MADACRWAERQSTRKTYVAVIAGKIVGFAELEKSGHIDGFYCHTDHQRCGVGRALLRRVKTEAHRQGNQKMSADVSITARPFFEHQGFRLVREQEVTLRGRTMTNFLMEHDLHC